MDSRCGWRCLEGLHSSTGGVFLLASLYFSTQNLAVQTASLSAVKEGQVTDRFTKAIEQLGAVSSSGTIKLEVRLGAIYALERIARDSERDNWPIMEVLTAYVRENSARKRPHQGAETFIRNPTPDDQPTNVVLPGFWEKPHLRVDIQAIFTVLSRHERMYDAGHSLDLHAANLSGASLRAVKYSSANCGDYAGVANLVNADLRGVDLSFADITYADLRGADLRGAFLYMVDIRHATLAGADLRLANLNGVHLDDTDLRGVNLRGTDLRNTYLGQDAINKALGSKETQLREGLQKPAHWLK